MLVHSLVTSIVAANTHTGRGALLAATRVRQDFFRPQIDDTEPVILFTIKWGVKHVLLDWMTIHW